LSQDQLLNICPFGHTPNRKSSTHKKRATFNEFLYYSTLQRTDYHLVN
jgi:hypothetical protein